MATGTQLEMSAQPGGNGRPQWVERLETLWTRARVRWAELEPKRRAWTIAAVVLLAAVAGALAWYALRTDWRVLYTGLDADDARQMEQALAAAQIPFDVTANGSAIRVPAPELDKGRLAAAKVGTKSGRMGFEIFDKPN
jgi:flagellar M-ring protein FliF